MKNIFNILSLLLFAQFSEAQQSYNITFAHDGKTVNGTFTSPKAIGKFPTIIICPGSGANDRNGTLPLTDGNSACLFPSLFGDTLRTYKGLSDALVQAGFCVLRYDKLEYTYPTTLGTITFHKLWLPFESAIDYVKSRNEVDTNKIILIGHSEGSSLIPIVAKKRKDIKALISIAGPRTPFDSIYAWQVNNLITLLRPCGATIQDSIDAVNQGNQILNYFKTIRNNTWNGSTPLAFGVPASAWYDYIRATDSVAINYNLANKPSLFLGMGLDIQVRNTELIRLKNEVNITNDFWTIPDLIHYMSTTTDPNISKAMTDTIVFWLNLRFKTSKLYEQPIEDNIIQIYFNQLNNELQISSTKQNINNLSLSVYTSSCKTVLISIEENIISPFIKIVDLSKQESGIYFIELEIDSKRMVKKIVID